MTTGSGEPEKEKVPGGNKIQMSKVHIQMQENKNKKVKMINIDL